MVINCKSKSTVSLSDNEMAIRFFNEIRHFKLLSNEEQVELLKQVKNGNENEAEAARNKLIECNQRFVASIAKHMTNGENFNDLISEGNIGLVKAIERFDTEYKQHFITYASYWIFNYMQEYLLHEKIVIPKNARRVYTYFNKISNKFFVINGRYPTTDEIQDELNKNGISTCSKDDLIPLKFLYIDENTDTFESDSDSDNRYSSVFTEYNNATSENNIVKIINNIDNKQRVIEYLNSLTYRERYIIKHFYGIGCEENTLDGIAKQLNCDREKIRREINLAIKKLRLKFKFKTYE